MRTSLTLRAGLLALGLIPALAPAAAAASPSPSPSLPSPLSSSPAATTVTTAGTSFLTASTLASGQDAAVAAATGDYLYWAFAATEGQTDTAQVIVTLPAATDRHGAETWSVELFDGLRRRQSCTAGPQNATATSAVASVTMSCTLRQIRSWAEPWSGDPLPGTYYVRLSASDIPSQDLGLAAQVHLHVTTTGGADDAQPEGGSLKAPLVPPGSAATPSLSASPGAVGAAVPVAPESHWYSDLFSGWNTRWFWTLGGGALAALAGVAGYTLTRHPRGHRRPTAHP